MAKKGRLKINVIGTAYMLKGDSLTARALRIIINILLMFKSKHLFIIAYLPACPKPFDNV